jgi:hypothetical protein
MEAAGAHDAVARVIMYIEVMAHGKSKNRSGRLFVGNHGYPEWGPVGAPVFIHGRGHFSVQCDPQVKDKSVTHPIGSKHNQKP